MIEKININGKDLSFDKLFERSLVDLSEEIPRPDTLISIGTHEYNGKTYPNDVMTAGEFSVITAPSKTRKTFYKSALCASYIGGKTNEYFPNIKSHRTEEFSIIDADTEQSEYYAQRSFRRVFDMVGGVYDNYFPLRMRFMSSNERLLFLDRLLYSDKIPKPKLLFIDGIADLIEDTNDLVMSNEVVQYVMKWTDELQIHICTIIHTAHGAPKATGHLGSAVTKKAETVFNLSRDGDGMNAPTKVVHSYSRGYPFDDFYFNVDNGLPYLCDHTETRITNESILNGSTPF